MPEPQKGAVKLITRCGCTRDFPDIQLLATIHVHMPTTQSEIGKEGIINNTETRTFIRTDATTDDGKTIYVEEMP